MKEQAINLETFMWHERDGVDLQGIYAREVRGSVSVEDGLMLAQARVYEERRWVDPTTKRSDISSELEKLPDMNIFGLVGDWLSIHNASRQPRIRQNCPDDFGRRFKDGESTLAWAQEARTAVLVFKRFRIVRNLASMVFFREKEHDHPDIEAGYTFGIRIYDGFEGRGLARQVMEASHRWLYERPIQSSVLPGFGGEDSSVWLEVNVDNEPARKAYKRFGYAEAAYDVLRNRVVMTYDGR